MEAKGKHPGRNVMSKAILIAADRIRYYKQQDKMLQSEIKLHGSPFAHDKNRTNTFPCRSCFLLNGLTGFILYALCSFSFCASRFLP